MLQSRKDIPYVGNPGNACALACYTMAAKYFFPETTFDELAKVARWVPGYVVWEMPFWNWIMKQGVHVTNYDLIDYQAWANKGLEGLRLAIPETEFNYYVENTHDIESYTTDIQANFANPLFEHKQVKPTWDDLLREWNEGAVCNIVLNWKALDNQDGFGLHQVVILDITDTHIEFHDPRGKEHEKPNRKETIEHFVYAWLETVDAPSLVTYKKK